MSCLKWSHFVCILLKLGCFSWFNICAVSVVKSENDATAKSWGTCYVTQKSTRSGSLLLSDGKFVGSAVDRFLKLFLFIVQSRTSSLLDCCGKT
jgi:hypothetical protein